MKNKGIQKPFNRYGGIFLLALGCCVLFFEKPLAADKPVVTLEKDKSGIQTIEASFIENVPLKTAWIVLTDYEGIPQFVTSMKSSHVVNRTEEAVMVEQTATGRFLWVKKNMNVLLLIKETFESTISFEDVRLKDFEFYRGEWAIFQEKGGVNVHYSLSMKTRESTPAFIENKAIKKNIAELLQQVQTEMRRRFNNP